MSLAHTKALTTKCLLSICVLLYLVAEAGRVCTVNSVLFSQSMDGHTPVQYTQKTSFCACLQFGEKNTHLVGTSERGAHMQPRRGGTSESKSQGGSGVQRLQYGCRLLLLADEGELAPQSQQQQQQQQQQQLQQEQRDWRQEEVEDEERHGGQHLADGPGGMGAGTEKGGVRERKFVRLHDSILRLSGKALVLGDDWMVCV